MVVLIDSLQYDASANSCRKISTEPGTMEFGVSVEITPNDNFNIFSLDPTYSLQVYWQHSLPFRYCICCWGVFKDLRRIVQVACTLYQYRLTRLSFSLTSVGYIKPESGSTPIYSTHYIVRFLLLPPPLDPWPPLSEVK